jgi:hypothetical protein
MIFSILKNEKTAPPTSHDNIYIIERKTSAPLLGVFAEVFEYFREPHSAWPGRPF